MTDQTAEVEEPFITRPGVYDLTFPEYLADPVVGGSLSSSGARMLLKRTPAHFRHYADHPEDKTSTADMDFGSAAHDIVLGRGKGIVEVAAADWRTKAAREARDAAAAEGKVALLSRDVETVHRMAEALRRHPLAAALLDPAAGRSEQTIVWQVAAQSPAHGLPFAVWCRAMLDFLRHPTDPDRPYELFDYKTTDDAATEAVMKTSARFGYHMQGDFYRRAVLSVPGLVAPGQRVRFSIIAQEKTPPFLVNVVTPDRDAMTIAARRVDEALEVYARCVATGEWPGYGDAANVGELPAWETRELREAW